MDGCLDIVLLLVCVFMLISGRASIFLVVLLWQSSNLKSLIYISMNLTACFVLSHVNRWCTHHWAWRTSLGPGRSSAPPWDTGTHREPWTWSSSGQCRCYRDPERRQTCRQRAQEVTTGQLQTLLLQSADWRSILDVKRIQVLQPLILIISVHFSLKTQIMS